MSKHGDYKTADAPKTEPLKHAAFAALADKIAKVNEALKQANEALREGGERFAAYEKEQTP